MAEAPNGSRAPVAGDPLLEAILAATAGATQAGRGWLFALTGDDLTIVAAHGPAAASRLGVRGPRSAGWAGSAVTSGRPVALSPRPHDPRFGGDLVADAAAPPSSLVCFPCPYRGEPVGALLLVDKAGGAPFVLDDVELVSLLSEIAGAAIAETAGGHAAAPPSPSELGADLRLLAANNPARYLAVATFIKELLLRI